MFKKKISGNRLPVTFKLAYFQKIYFGISITEVVTDYFPFIS